MTELIIKVEGLEKVDFSILFYVERNNVIEFKKEELIKVYKDNTVEYYAPVDANRLGRGHLMAAVEIMESEPAYPKRVRKVVINGFTGYSFPCLGDSNSIECGKYNVTFKRVADIPKNDAVIRYGVTRDRFDEVDLNALQGSKDIKEFTLAFNEGERVVVAIPYDRTEEARKDNGFGEGVPFSTAIDGRNGGMIEYDGIRYRLFGELMIVNGRMKVYIL